MVAGIKGLSWNLSYKLFLTEISPWMVNQTQKSVNGIFGRQIFLFISTNKYMIQSYDTSYETLYRPLYKSSTIENNLNLYMFLLK